MNNFFTLLIVSFFSITLFGQKDTLSINLDYKAKGYKSKESVAISNSNNGDLVILIEDKKETVLKLIDEDGQIKKELKTDRLGPYLVNFLGHHYFDDGTYAIVFSDSSKTIFSALKFNFENKNIEQIGLDFKFNKEKYVESITQNNTFYLFTANKRKSNDVNFYELNGNNSFNKNTVSFEFISTIENGFRRYPINILTTRAFGSGSLTKIDPYSPNSIQTTSGENKLYQLKDELLFSFDKDVDSTKIIRLNLNDFSVKTSKFPKPVLNTTNNEVEVFFGHNSYINDSIIYHLTISRKQMKFRATDMGSKQILKEFYVAKDDSIAFKNGPIILEKTGEAAMFSEKERKLEKTAKFLRKVSVSKVGITAMEIEDQLQLTIGGFIEVKSSGGATGLNFGAPAAAAFVAGNVAFNPVYTAYNSYGSTKSTFINCLFDKQYNHIEGEVRDNVFDDIKDYEDYFKKHEVDKQWKNGEKYVTPAKMKLKNVFYHNGNHYLGYLNTIDRNYHLVKF